MSSTQDFAASGADNPSPIAQATNGGRFNEEFEASQRGSSLIEAADGNPQRTNSTMSQSQTVTPSRGGTLKKRNSLKKSASLRRSNSRRSLGAGSVKSLALGDREKYEGSDFLSAFNTPVPTKGSPTDILANRFQDWRRVLKDLIAYFREVQKSHEARSKSLLSLSSLASNISGPTAFRKEGGIGEATNILKQYHKQALTESNKAKSIEEDIMQQLTGLRSDLAQKIKEIKNLSGDFKNSCDKETDSTRKTVRNLQEALGMVDTDPGATSGKGDPFIVRLAVERQLEKQIDEENYLHKAFLNLEHSGRELESIVVGEIQKAYNAYAGILKREADEAYETVESLRSGPIIMPKDTEWDTFVSDNEHFVDPRMPLRKPHQITYPGKDAPAAAEVRSGLLERKSKYLKSYTPGWYVLSPTHLHEFKSPDRISSQTPVMSLYLPEQKLGSHSNVDSSSHKFMLKGRQTGGMHRGHGWVFRAESRDTMLAWFEDMKNLTEKTGMERDAFVRRHARSISAHSLGAGSVSSDGALEEDEADRVPYSADHSQLDASSSPGARPQRPQPGGRFPSDLNVDHDLPMPISTSSATSSDEQQHAIARGALTSDANEAVVSPRNPTEAYRQASYESYHDELYATGTAGAPNQSLQQETDRAVTDAPLLASPPPAEEESVPETGHATIITQYTISPHTATEKGGHATAPSQTAAATEVPQATRAYHPAPERASTPPASAAVEQATPRASDANVKAAGSGSEALGVSRAPESASTMASTAETPSDPKVGSTERIAAGGTPDGGDDNGGSRGARPSVKSIKRQESEPGSIGQLHVPGEYRA